MIRSFMFLLCLGLSAFGLDLAEIRNLFEAKNYRQVCSNSVEKLFKQTNDEALMNMYAISCLKINEINRLAIPMFKMVRSKEARENAAYFANILFKKKLLYHAVIDNVDISYIRLPKSDYILSTIFDKFVEKQYEIDGDSYFFKEPNSDTYYELGKNSDYGDVVRLFLKTYKNDELISEVEYW